MSEEIPAEEQPIYRRRDDRPPGPTCVDLFAGAGGLAEGFRQAGFGILSGVDSDQAAGKTFRANFPEATFFEQGVEDVVVEALMEDAGLRPGELDVLIGGPPCQSFSYNNHQRSEKDQRAGLFRHYLRILDQLSPKTLVMENVPGILTVGGGRVVDEIVETLNGMGYDVDIRILYAEEYGVPQERRRVFVIGSMLGSASSLFPHGSYGPVPKPSREANRWVHRWERQEGVQYGSMRSIKVWPAIGDLPPLENGEGSDVSEYSAMPKTKLQRLLRGDQDMLYNHVARNMSPQMLERVRHVPEGGSWRDIPFDLLPAGMQRAKRSCHTKRYGRLERGGACCTILTKLDPHWGSYVHPTQDRCLSIREAARLQSFPDRFRFMGYMTHQMEQVGNAVPPLMAAAVAGSVRQHIQEYGPADDIAPANAA